MAVVPFHVILLAKSEEYVHDKRTWMYFPDSLSCIKEFNPPPLKLFQLRATARCLKTNAKGPRPLSKLFTLVKISPF